MFFDKGIIMACSRIYLENVLKIWIIDGGELSLQAKLIIGFGYVIENYISVVHFNSKLQEMASGELGEFKMPSYPNTSRERALMIIVPMFYELLIKEYLTNTYVAFSFFCNFWGLQIEKQWYFYTFYWRLGQYYLPMMMIANLFILAYLPQELYWPTFGCAIAGPLVHDIAPPHMDDPFAIPCMNGSFATFQLFIFNLFAYFQWHLSEVNVSHLHNSLIVLAVYFILYYLCIKYY